MRAIFSRDIKKAERLVEAYGAEYAADGIEELAKTGVEVVYIASPNKLHFEQAEFFLKNNKHVICEKPIVTKKGQLFSLYETARQNGVFLFEALRHIHTPGFEAIKKNIESITPVRSAFFSFNQYSSRYDDFKKGTVTNVFSKELDGGAKFDLGIYPISLAVALFGSPKSVLYSPHNLSNGVCASGAYIFEYEGFPLSISFSKISHDLVENQIIGEGGGICFSRPAYFGDISLHIKGRDPKDISVFHDDNPLFYEATTFGDIIKSGDIKKYDELSQISIAASEILLSY